MDRVLPVDEAIAYVRFIDSIPSRVHDLMYGALKAWGFDISNSGRTVTINHSRNVEYARRIISEAGLGDYVTVRWAGYNFPELRGFPCG